jgi:2-iminobutanoate/2-iminopropanoate deaminase
VSTFAVQPEGLLSHPSMSQGVVAEGTQIYVSGQLALEADGTPVAPYDIDAQLDRIWTQIEMVLAAAGSSLDDVVRVTAWTTDRVFCPTIVAKRVQVFEGRRPPASAMVVVAGLARAECVVEIDAFAVRSA